jgi:hypothetical protein
MRAAYLRFNSTMCALASVAHARRSAVYWPVDTNHASRAPIDEPQTRPLQDYVSATSRVNNYSNAIALGTRSDKFTICYVATSC